MKSTNYKNRFIKKKKFRPFKLKVFKLIQEKRINSFQELEKTREEWGEIYHGPEYKIKKEKINFGRPILDETLTGIDKQINSYKEEIKIESKMKKELAKWRPVANGR